MRKTLLAAIAALAMVILLACPTGGGDGGVYEPEPTPQTVPQSVRYTGRADNADGSYTVYSLAVSESTGGAKYVAKQNDTYVLTVTYYDKDGNPTGTQVSSGTVSSVSGGNIILKPTAGTASATFTVTTSGTGMTGISGSIVFDDKTTAPPPGTLIPQNTNAPKVENMAVDRLPYHPPYTYTPYTGSGTLKLVFNMTGVNLGSTDIGKIESGKVSFTLPDTAPYLVNLKDMFQVPTAENGSGYTEQVTFNSDITISPDTAKIGIGNPQFFESGDSSGLYYYLGYEVQTGTSSGNTETSRSGGMMYVYAARQVSQFFYFSCNLGLPAKFASAEKSVYHQLH